MYTFLPPTGFEFLDQVTFIPGSTAASIATQPAGKTVAAGSNVTLNVTASGTPPFGYQWYFNGGYISGATGAALALTNVQSGDSGTYYVVVTNAIGLATSSTALLTVTSSIPVFVTQPVSGSAFLGGSMAFSGQATGTSPIYYQWLRNGLPLSGATNLSLTLSNVQHIDTGSYSLLVSNGVGSAVSSNALFIAYTVDDLGATLDNPAVIWSTTDVPWFPQSVTTHDGTSAAQSGVISGSQQSTLQGVVTGPAMVVYWWKVNCDSFWDSLAFSDNGTIQSSIAGVVDWQQATNFIGSRSHVLQWSLYPVHGAIAGGTAWVDQVQIIPITGVAPAITTNPVSSTVSAGNKASFSVSATGTASLLYQWQLNGSDLPGATNATLTLTNVQAVSAGSYSVNITNDYGFAVSSNAALTINPSAPAITSQPVSQTNAITHSSTFTIRASGSQPLNYQWLFNGSPIPSATGTVLVLTNLQMSDAGSYSAAIANDYGTNTSSSAYLTVAQSMVVEFWPRVLGSPLPTNDYTAPLYGGDLSALAVGAFHTLALRTDGTVLAWGDNSYGQINVPAGLSNVTAIADGDNFCLTLKSDGTIVGWGDNGYGQASSPPGLSNVVAISAGPMHSLALKSDGTVMGWGNDINGQVDVPVGLVNVQAIAAWFNTGGAVKSDGTLTKWGNNPVLLHNGTNTQLLIGGGQTNWVGIGVGTYTGWALQDDGTVLAYGWYDGVAPFTNNVYGSSVQWSIGTHGQNIYSNIAAIVSYGYTTPFNEYALLLGINGGVTLTGGFPDGLGSSIPYVQAASNYFSAMAAGSAHAAGLLNSGAPCITRQPFNRTVYNGSSVRFSAGVTGHAPMSYQWQVNGTNIDSATNSLLVLANIGFAAVGSYQCIVSNSSGVITNVNASLAILRSPSQILLTTGGMTNGAFAFTAGGLTGHGNVVVFASTNLVDWQPIFTNPPVVGTLQLLDPTNYLNWQYYRVLEQ